MAWTHRGRRRRRGRSLRLHLRRGRRLPCRRQCYCRAQSKLKYSSYSFLHSYRRSSHSDQRLFLSRLTTFPGTGGHVCETNLSSRNAAAFSQFTVGPRIRQGIAPISLSAFRCNTCPFFWHLITVKMRPNPAGMAPSDACRPYEKNRTPSCMGHRRGDFPSPTCGPARARKSCAAAASIRQTGCAEFLSASRAFRQETPLPGDPAHRRTHMDGQRHRRAGR